MSLWLAGCQPAGTVVAAHDKAGRELRWKTEVLRFEVVASELGASRALLEAAKGAASAWRAPGIPSIEVELAKTPREAREDGVNVIVLRQDRWCPKAALDGCYPKEQAAFTRPYMSSRSEHWAEVLETDIELNAIDFHFDASREGRERLVAVLAHEFGHALGLDHDCRVGGVGGSSEKKLPRCDDAQALGSVMHPSPLLPGRTFVTQPSAWQLEGLAALYRSTP